MSVGVKVFRRQPTGDRRQLRGIQHHTGQDLDKINLDTERDNFMDAEEAKKYGLVDEVIASR